MAKQLFFVLQMDNANGQHIAIAVSQNTNVNLYHVFDAYNNEQMGIKVKVVHYCETWKKALELESAWNNGFKENGTLWQCET